jgi:hypothetical protein
VIDSLKSNARKDATGENTAKGHKLAEEMDVLAMVNGSSHQLIHEKQLLFLQEAKIDRIENQIMNVEVEYITLRNTSTSSTTRAKASSGGEKAS